MDNEYTQKVLTAVERAKREVRSAESHFEYEKNRIERETRYTTIDIYNMSKAVEILADVKRTTDNLYTSYESIIRALDMQCRPYLDYGISGEAIKEVADLMKEINEESSSLSSNVTGTFNYSSMGDLRSEHYFASIEAKSIEKFWAAKYSMTPEAEAERKQKEAALAERRKRQAEQARIAAERKKKEEEEKKRKAELKAAEEKRIAKLNSDAKQHMDKWDKNCNQKLVEYEKELNSFIESQRKQYESEIREKIEELRITIDNLKQKETQLKAFKFSEKKSIKEEIQKLELRVLKFENTDIISSEINLMKEKAAEAVEKYRGKLDAYMSQRFTDYKTSTTKKSKTTLLYIENVEMASTPIPSGEIPEEVFR